MNPQKLILPLIVVAQFFCTSLWFAGNGVMDDLISNFGLAASALGNLTAAVQFGFIIGTLFFAILTIADRFSPSKVFFVSALFGALFNLGILYQGNGLSSILFLRFLTGFSLAGIYPVGMKIATDYYDKGLGKSLGFLVGALVLGTALPHLLKGLSASLSWSSVIVSTSLLAAAGGLLLVLLVPDGPYRKQGAKIQLTAFFSVFRARNFRAAAFGYFGHMWELYAFWAFVPLMLKTYGQLHPFSNFDIPVLSFLIIAVGGLSCFWSGFLAQRFGTKKVAFSALLLSGTCALFSPLVFAIDQPYLFLGFLLFWGMVVIMDSPMFSTLVAQNAKPEIKGTALTIVNCIGFAITIISIQLINITSELISSNGIYALLAMGPIFGLIALGKTGFGAEASD